jgi:hypothetical protein
MSRRICACWRLSSASNGSIDAELYSSNPLAAPGLLAERALAFRRVLILVG